MKDEVEILLDLVAIPSVSSVGHRPVIDYELKRLNPAAWKIKLHPYRDPKGIATVNLVAITRGPNVRPVTPELTLVCHTDTVPGSGITYGPIINRPQITNLPHMKTYFRTDTVCCPSIYPTY